MGDVAKFRAKFIAPIEIVSTDYKTYSIEWSCSEAGDNSSECKNGLLFY